MTSFVNFRLRTGSLLQAGSEWCCWGGLNSRPQPYQGCALPLSYSSQPFMRRKSGKPSCGGALLALHPRFVNLWRTAISGTRRNHGECREIGHCGQAFARGKAGRQAARKPAPAKSAGARALRLGALGLLAARGQPADIARVARHFNEARNATDEIGALAILSTLSVPERAKAFDRFYARWKDDHLVIASWFGLQATSPLASTLRTVKQLMAHPLFSMRTPNRRSATLNAPFNA